MNKHLDEVDLSHYVGKQCVVCNKTFASLNQIEEEMPVWIGRNKDGTLGIGHSKCRELITYSSEQL